jgi:hypothetical protein
MWSASIARGPITRPINRDSLAFSGLLRLAMRSIHFIKQTEQISLKAGVQILQLNVTKVAPSDRA